VKLTSELEMPTIEKSFSALVLQSKADKRAPDIGVRIAIHGKAMAHPASTANHLL